MIIKTSTKLVTVIALLLTSIGCRESRRIEEVNMEQFPIYISKDTLFIEENVYRQIPIVDRYIEVERSKSIIGKITSIADSLSYFYFNDLRILVGKIDSVKGQGSILNISLVENPGYNGPGSLPMYFSWYDYFQGSSGGQNTTFILEESILQKSYQGDWIDGVVFFYQGDSIGLWDHLYLDGVLSR